MNKKSIERYSNKNISQREIEENAINELIDQSYKHLLEKSDKAPHIDEIVNMCLMSKREISNYAAFDSYDMLTYATHYMLGKKNVCYMFGEERCDCQQVLIKELYGEEEEDSDLLIWGE